MAKAVYGAHGHVFAVDSDVPGIEDRVASALGTLRLPHDADASRYRIERRDDNSLRLSCDGDEIGVRYSDDGVLLLLHWHVNQRVIDAATAVRTTFHAAAACSPRGTGILLPAPMESGKTTTVTGLLRAGWDFLTDEAAAVDPDGTMWAYPKPLTVDRGSWPLFPELRPNDVGEATESWLVPATAAGARVVDRAQTGLIVFPAYAADQATEVERLRPSEAALELAHSTFQFDLYGERDLRCVSALARNVPAYRLRIGDLAQAVALIDELESAAEAAA